MRRGPAGASSDHAAKMPSSTIKIAMRMKESAIPSLPALPCGDQLEVSFTGRSVATLFLLPLLSGALLRALPQGGLTALCFLALVLDRALLALLPRRDALPPVRALLQIPRLRLPHRLSEPLRGGGPPWMQRWCRLWLRTW